LLCTDGLHNELRVDEIQHIMKQNEKQEDRAEALVAGAKSAGGRDNITAMLINLSAVA
jgi:protein phosphatase